MRQLYVLLFTICLAITVFDGQASEAVAEHRQGSPRSTAEAGIHEIPGHRLLRSVNVEKSGVESEERGFPGLSKLNEWFKKGKSKMSDMQLRVQYKDVSKHGMSDDKITKAWVQQGKVGDDIYSR
ncbi:secreted RxLR effector peptide protein, putative [Phytophthora infestans T30-4]|uniref:RxLR effector protein n=1 Tax=Phytophthora infestans (strain T30-4) TaxID=403677 RepID=D0NTB9_PHYIT|nr:secreted RxLR effector peptide protein, putative [Phytophthora infestans T30-4]EEY64870.1 secreted RxLR effector peptide protein, putative [Phytophthora infestans T30-4]|eukprot:XP_002897600.1 secreted RxLR effector peptide protein, putative [Phytophthora infestans T30-4]